MGQRLTVITPIFNGEHFVESCLLNVIEQDCPDIEHLIVDGGSTDATVTIVRSYAEMYRHIKLVSAPDRGQSDAMNKGVGLASAGIIGFLNVDDFYEPGTLRFVSDKFVRLPEASLLVGNCNVWDDNGKVAEINCPANLQITDLMLGWAINPYPINSSQYFYHKALHNLAGLYDIDEHYALDIDFLSRAVQVANIYYIDRIFGNYRKIAGTKTVCDIENGLCDRRFNSVLEKYRKQLPLLQRVEIILRKLLHRARIF